MFQLFEYGLPFRTPFRAGSSVFKKREGVLLRYRNNNLDYVTEASPLPGFSTESLSDVKKVLLDHKEEIENFLDGHLTLQMVRDLNQNRELKLPSVQFALSYLALSVLAKRRGKTFHDLFRSIPAESLKVNDVIGHAPVDEMKRNIERSIQKGYKVIKIKAPHPVDDLASLLSDIREKYHGIEFRLDANQSWSGTVLKNSCKLFRNIPVQYIEEPARVNNPDDIQHLQNQCSISLAFDESVSTLERLENFLKTYSDTVFIVKPMLLGNILETYETISRFRSSFKHIVCTTAIESGIGRSMVATTASLLGDPDMSHGLNTGYLLADDLLPDYKVENGLLKSFLSKSGTRSFRDIKTSYINKLRKSV